eukprot:gene9784-7668_t
MAALKKALFSLFGGPGNLPAKEDLDDVARDLFYTLVETAEGNMSRGSHGRTKEITRKDLYTYMVKQSQVGISTRSVDKLFSKIDLNSDGNISESEFVTVMNDVYTSLSRDRAFEDRLKVNVPDNHVVAGSSRMNGLSGTRAFRMQVITVAEFKRYISRRQASLLPMSASIFHSLDTTSSGQVTFKHLLERLFPEAQPSDIKLLMRMARPKNYIPHSKPDEEMMQGDYRRYRSGWLDGPLRDVDPDGVCHWQLQRLASQRGGVDVFN